MARNPFEILGLPLTFELESRAIQSAFLARISQAHPDSAPDSLSGENFAVGGQHSFQGVAEDTAASNVDPASLNQARATLEDPFRRAEALLDAMGIVQNQKLPQGFLIQMMTLHETIDEAIETGNSEDLRTQRNLTGQLRNQTIERFKEALAKQHLGDPADSLPLILNSWRYIERLIERIDGSNKRP